MKVDTVITLANGKNYLLLMEDDIQEEDYFLAVLLDQNDEPTDQYAVLKEVEKDGELYSQKINNPIVLNELLDDFRRQYQEEYED